MKIIHTREPFVVAADELRRQVNEALQEKEKLNMGICGGRAMPSLLEHIEDLPWAKIHLYLVDERWVPMNDTESNYRQLIDEGLGKFIQTGILPKSNLHPFDINSITPGTYGVDRFDIILVSMGEDGHIASLFPGRDHGTAGYITVDESPKPPSRRISASAPLLLTSRHAILLAIGEGKWDAFERFEEDGPASEIPARLVKNIEDSIVVTDKHE